MGTGFSTGGETGRTTDCRTQPAVNTHVTNSSKTLCIPYKHPTMEEKLYLEANKFSDFNLFAELGNMFVNQLGNGFRVVFDVALLN